MFSSRHFTCEVSSAVGRTKSFADLDLLDFSLRLRQSFVTKVGILIADCC